MTLIEFLDPIARAPQAKLVLATVLYLDDVAGDRPVTAAQVRQALIRARVKGAKSWNVPGLLGKAGANVHSTGKDASGVKLWQLTDTGREHVLSYVEAPVPATRTSRHLTDVEQIRQTVFAIPNEDARAYAEEAVQCLAISAHRAAIVFMWVAAVHEIQERIWSASNPTDITSAAQKHSPKAKVAKKRDDLVEYNEALLLQVAHTIGVLDKNEKSELVKGLDLRNSCGHPNKYQPGVHKAKAHIEDIVNILFK